MKIIYTNKGNKIFVDDDVYEELNQHVWCLNNYGYAYRKTKVDEPYSQSHILMHRYIVGVINDRSVVVDHADHNILNNTRDNLRICNQSKNGMNQKLSTRNTTGFKGVHYRKDRGKYQAYIQHKGKKTNLGTYDTAEEAGLAYNSKALELFGEFALLNNIEVI
jgi:hypothetical protein